MNRSQRDAQLVGMRHIWKNFRGGARENGLVVFDEKGTPMECPECGHVIDSDDY